MLYAACSAGALCCTICDISPATQTCPMRPPYRLRGYNVERCTGMGITGIPRNPWESRGIRGNPTGMEANVAGFPRGWKDMSRDSREDGKTCTRFLWKCSCI